LGRLTAVNLFTPPTQIACVNTLIASATHTAGTGKLRTRSIPNLLSNQAGSKNEVVAENEEAVERREVGMKGAREI